MCQVIKLIIFIHLMDGGGQYEFKLARNPKEPPFLWGFVSVHQERDRDSRSFTFFMEV